VIETGEPEPSSRATPHWRRPGRAGNADLTHSFDAERVHMRVLLFDQDGLERLYVGVTRSCAKMGFNSHFTGRTGEHRRLRASKRPIGRD
jgi:hypothetical protein